MGFVNLYLESEYTMLKSPIKLQELIAKAVSHGHTHLAITDLDNMHGAYKFYNLCRENNIKPIIGLNLSMESKLNFYNSILLYAKHFEGYKNLLKISSFVKVNKQINLNELKKYSQHLIAIIPCEENEVVKLFFENNIDLAKETLLEYKNIFDDIYMGINFQNEENIIRASSIIKFAEESFIDCVAIHKTTYLEKDDFFVYETLRCIGLGVNEYLYTENELFQYFISREEANELFKDYPKLIENTIKIANKCNVELDYKGYDLPVFPDANGRSFEYLSDLCKIGLNKRLRNNKTTSNVEVYKKRLLYELDILKKMGYCDYFLIVYDFVKYAKNNEILVGPGRGSAPGSLVAYCLGITNIDPIRYDLLFERFLNPERVSMPDIDIDFPDNKRDEVIQYVLGKYGKNKVAHISTFGTFGVRLATRDVARVMKLNDIVLNEVLKFIKNNDTSINDIILENEQFRDLVNNNIQINKLAKIVAKLEGLPRHISTHAAGIIISGKSLLNYTAVQEGMNGLYQTQYEASDLEKIGLLKFDFLGIRNLTIIDDVSNRIRKNNPDFDINKISLDDTATYKMIASGDTDGIFQLESGGMKNVLIGLKTSNFMDIVNANALFRPGPKEMIPSFINRKFGREKIDYIDDSIKDILIDTYGTIVFQEQIMLIAQRYAGYTLGMADLLRRAVSKKDADILINERKRFVENALKQNHSLENANKVYDYIVKFANYGFNKSHSVAYSMVSYQMAYLKQCYYKHFISVLMSNSIGSVESIINYINDCKKRGISILGPSVNYSSDEFVVSDLGIYYSLLGIANLGAVTLSSFLEERNTNGLYKSYEDFILRTKDILNKRVVENLIHAGALDEFKIPRKQMVLEYNNILNYAKYDTLLGGSLLEKKYSDEEYSYEEISSLEREALGFNLKYSIFRKYHEFARKWDVKQIAELMVNKKNTHVLFAIKDYRIIKTKNNNEMAFIVAYDETDAIDGVLFPNIYSEIKHNLEKNSIYFAEVNFEYRNDKKQIIINQIKKMG